jgi:hypothetical protein
MNRSPIAILLFLLCSCGQAAEADFSYPRLIGLPLADAVAELRQIGIEIGSEPEAAADPDDKGWSLKNRKEGIEIHLSQKKQVDAIWLDLAGREGDKYRRFFWRGLTPSSTRADVIRVLGKPDETGPAAKIPGLGDYGPWIKYHLEACQLHFEFAADGRIAKVTLLRRDWKPGD